MHLLRRIFGPNVVGCRDVIPFVAAIWSDVRRGSDDLVLLQESSPGGNASIGSQTYAERDDDHFPLS